MVIRSAISRVRSVSVIFVVWIIIGIIVAWDRDYLSPAVLKLLLAAVLAILLWPLVLLGVSMR